MKRRIEKSVEQDIETVLVSFLILLKMNEVEQKTESVILIFLQIVHYRLVIFSICEYHYVVSLKRQIFPFICPCSTYYTFQVTREHVPFGPLVFFLSRWYKYLGG